MILQTSAITIPERIREEFDMEELARLAASLKALGQLQPVLIDSNNVLTAGERRIRAINLLAIVHDAASGMQPGEVWAELKESKDPRVTLQREFDENNQRADFNFLEKAKFIRRFHETMVAEVGPEWKQEFTAASLRLSVGSISNYLRIEEAVKNDPTVAKATTINSAVKRIKSADARKARAVEVKNNAPEATKRAESIILLGDARELIKTIADSSVDLINFDPPWGDETGRKSNENWDGFEDDTETSDSIINDLLPELYRVLKPNRIMIYWYRTWAYDDMIERLETAGFNFKFTRTPCIWYKPDKVSDQNRYPEKRLLSTYETFLLARKGDPIFHQQGHQDVFVHNRVALSALIHPTEKPTELCTELLRITTIPGEMVFDPTAGSAAILFSALLTGRRAVGFELSRTIRERSLIRIAEHLRNVR